MYSLRKVGKQYMGLLKAPAMDSLHILLLKKNIKEVYVSQI